MEHLAACPSPTRRRLQAQAHELALGDDAPLRRDALPWGFCAVEAERAFAEPAWTAALHESRAFHDPSTLQRMLAAYSVQPASLVAPVSREQRAAAAAQAQQLRRASDSAWAAEALRRGVAHARGGDHAAALRSYGCALELWPGCVDALVAQGAALASLGRLEAGERACCAALEADPSHSNAAAYLATIRARLAEAPPAATEPPEPPAAVPPAALEALRAAASALRKEKRRHRDSGDKKKRDSKKEKRHRKGSGSGEDSEEQRRRDYTTS